MDSKDTVLKDAARMLRRAARILDAIADSPTTLPKRVSDAIANIEAAKARIYGRTDYGKDS